MLILLQFLGAALGTMGQTIGFVVMVFATLGLWREYSPQIAKRTGIAKEKVLWGGGAGILLVSMGIGWWMYNLSKVPIPLVAAYDISTLPIWVPPNTTLKVLRLHPQVRHGSFALGRRGGDGYVVWPSDEDGADRAPEIILQCDVQNLGDVPMLNVEMVFRVSFHERPKDQPTPEERERGGLRLVYPVSRQEHRFIIEQIDEKSTATFFIVNQSVLNARVTFPVKATALMAGESERRTIPFTRKYTPVVGTGSWFPLPPSTIKWYGLPE